MYDRRPYEGTFDQIIDWLKLKRKENSFFQTWFWKVAVARVPYLDEERLENI